MELGVRVPEIFPLSKFIR